MLATKRTVINGATYELTLFGSIEGMRVLTNLIRLLGPSLGPVLRSEAVGLLSQGKAEGAAMAAILHAIPELATRIQPEDLEELVQTFGLKCLVHKPGLTKGPAALTEHRDALWAGDYGSLFKWLVWCCQENFRGFLPAAGAPGTSIPQAPAPSSSPNT